MSGVTFDDVQKKYGDIVAVEKMNIEIRDGEFVSILGPSGSGKSTMLRMIAGLEEISDGTVSIGDRVINDVPPAQRDIAMVFQNYALYPHMTVRDNMSYGLKLTTDLSKDEIQTRVEDAAELLGISGHLDKKPSGLSGGQQQRVATGRAIVREPEVFLMDEPLSNLDAKLKMELRTELQRIHNELETTTIYVTHDQEEAMTMSDRIAIINDGDLQQFGTPDEIYNEPANLFVAGFIGSPAMNLFDVTLYDEVLQGSEFEYPLSPETLDMASPLPNDKRLVLGVRPEDIAIENDRTADSITTTVDVVEPVGSDNYIYSTIEGQQCTIRVPANIKPEPGQQIHITFEESSIHLFDADTDQNLLYAANMPNQTELPYQQQTA